jgi:ABC-type lipoprotein export system ATPase subunit
MNDPAVVLADEPTGNLDTQHGAAIWQLLASLCRRQSRTIVAVTHEADGAAFADRVLVLKDGRLAGEIQPDGEGNASLVASGYRELVG